MLNVIQLQIGIVKARVRESKEVNMQQEGERDVLDL